MGRRNVPGGKWACACCCRCCWVAAAAAAAAERATDDERDVGTDEGEDEALSDGSPPPPPPPPPLPGGNTVPQPELAGLLLLLLPPFPLPLLPLLVSGIPSRALSSSLQAGCPPLLELSTSETPLSAGLGGSEPAYAQGGEKRKKRKLNSFPATSIERKETYFFVKNR